MKEMVTYLTFPGNCREAMTFYTEALGGRLSLMEVGPDTPGGQAARHLIMHASVTFPKAKLMASDAMPWVPGGFYPGNNFSISIDCDTIEEEQRYFAALVAGGAVVMELQDTFWNAHFGMARDKFGITWMFNFDKAQG